MILWVVIEPDTPACLEESPSMGESLNHFGPKLALLLSFFGVLKYYHDDALVKTPHQERIIHLERAEYRLFSRTPNELS